MDTKQDPLLWFAIIIVALCALFAVILAYVGPDEAELDRIEYCQHVRAWHISHGRAGWPDFNNNYDQLCKEYVDAKR